MVSDSKYNIKSHMDWVDKNNFCSHFGIHPKQLHCVRIHFYCFHVCSAITRWLLKYLREFIRAQTFEISEALTADPSWAWGPFYLSMWSCNKAFSVLGVRQVLAFINFILAVVTFLRDQFVITDFSDNLCERMLVWKQI